MDSFKGQGGIQMLLTAEQEAQHIVTSARNLKIARLKQAKEEAEKEVVMFRSHLEKEFQSNLSESSGSAGAKRIEEETEMRITNLKESSSKVSPAIVEMVIKFVTTVKV